MKAMVIMVIMVQMEMRIKAVITVQKKEDVGDIW